MPEFLPFLGSIRRIAVTYGTHDETGAPGVDERRQAAVPRRVAGVAARDAGHRAARAGRARDGQAAPTRPARREAADRTAGSPASCPRAAARWPSSCGRSPRRCPPGTTLRVEILAERRGSELRTDVTAEADNVHVHTWLDGVQAIDRTFKAPRRGDVDLLGEALETGGKDPLAVETIRKAAQLVGHGHID